MSVINILLWYKGGIVGIFALFRNVLIRDHTVLDSFVCDNLFPCDLK
jgi:hypothetical protein